MIDELTQAVGTARSSRLQASLRRAAEAYRRDRYQEALRLLDSLARQAPEVAAIRELRGLTLYRLGRWRQALRELEALRARSDAPDQLPVIADCHRALGHLAQARECVEELRSRSAGPELLTEGRLVLAGALADSGQLRDAIETLLPLARAVKHPAERHLRAWYALADLYERAGDLPQARRLFALVSHHDPQLGDARQRLAGLG